MGTFIRRSGCGKGLIPGTFTKSFIVGHFPASPLPPTIKRWLQLLQGCLRFEKAPWDYQCVIVRVIVLLRFFRSFRNFSRLIFLPSVGKTSGSGSWLTLRLVARKTT